jgi:hypothetical protein
LTWDTATVQYTIGIKAGLNADLLTAANSMKSY